MKHPNVPTIPTDVLNKIKAHRPHLANIINNIPLAPAQAEKALADAYLQGETKLTGKETYKLAACSAGRGYGEPVGPGKPFENRIITKRVKLTPEENNELNRRVDESGLTWSQYVRGKLFG